MRLSRARAVACAVAAGLAALASPPAAAAKATTASEHRVRVVKSWPEDAIVDGRSVPARVEIVMDYTARVVIQRLVVPSTDARQPARVLSSKTLPPGVGQPRPSEEEIAEAFALVRADADIAQVIKATQAVLDGGFQVFEPAGKLCGPGSRCLKVQLMTDNRLGFIRNVIVDLTKEAIVYRTWMPQEEETSK